MNTREGASTSANTVLHLNTARPRPINRVFGERCSISPHVRREAPIKDVKEVLVPLCRDVDVLVSSGSAHERNLGTPGA